MILVVGATGVLGMEITRRLREQGKPVRGLVRSTSNPDKVRALEAMGVDVVRGNLKDRASLDAACQGVDTVISTATITASRQPDDTIQNVDHEGQLSLVDAAKEAGVRRFIYISAFIEADSPLKTAKRAVEQRLKASGLNYTILRPGMFMEIWISPLVGFDYPNRKATIYGEGTNKLAWVSLFDVAAVAVAALDNPAAENAVFDMGGPEDLTALEVVRYFEHAAGAPFEVQHVPVEALIAQNAQAEDSVQQSFTALMIDYATGGPIEMQPVAQTFPLRWTSVKEYASQVMAQPHRAE